MKQARSITAFLLALCLSAGMLFATVTPAAAEEDDTIYDLLKIFDVSEEIYNNYETLYAESLPVEYVETENPGYTALGGITASGIGSDREGSDDDNSYAKRFADHLGLGDDYINAANNKITKFKDLEAYFNGTDVKQSIYKSDIITFQLDSSMIISASIDSIATINYTPDWSKYVSAPELNEILEGYRSEYTDKYGASAAKALECMLFQSVAFAFETVNAVEKIRELNPKATIIVLGLYNPLSGLKFTMNNKTILVDDFLGSAIESCNVFLLDRTMKMDNVAFVDISDTHAPGFDGVVLNLDNGISNDDWTAIQSNPAAQHADADGHDDIFNQLLQTTDRHVSHALDEGTVSKKPGCDTEGEMLHKCVVPNCTYTEIKPIAPAGHTADNFTDNKDATCEKAGTLSAVCKVCHAPFTVENPEGPVDHEYGKGGACIFCGANKPLGAGAIVAIVLGSLAVLAGGVFGGLWFYKNKMVKNKENTDADELISVEESVESEETAEVEASVEEQAETEEKTVADEDASVEEKEQN